MLSFDPNKNYDRIFSTSIPKWLCAASDVRESAYLVPHSDQSTVIFQKDNNITALSNICAHKQSLIFKEHTGRLGTTITCPVHKWTWERSGAIRKAPGFENQTTMNLNNIPVYNWNGHIFKGPDNWLQDIEKLGNNTSFVNIDNYNWHSHQKLEYNFSWTIFMEIFLDLYHVKSFHPGLRSLTDCKDFAWSFGDNWLVQTGSFRREMPLEPTYKNLYDFYVKNKTYDTAKFGAVWLLIYPNIMIEYYPGCIVVSTVWPNGQHKCINYLDFYYEKNLLDIYPNFADAMFDCFMVTANEDEEIGQRMQAGRALTHNRLPLFNHPTEEVGYTPFFNWLDKQLDECEVPTHRCK
jgi:choline monooxygenase